MKLIVVIIFVALRLHNYAMALEPLKTADLKEEVPVVLAAPGDYPRDCRIGNINASQIASQLCDGRFVPGGGYGRTYVTGAKYFAQETSDQCQRNVTIDCSTGKILDYYCEWICWSGW